MKCPNCGSDMEDGKLYCEVCGEEIHIVPDFEPEIEYSITQTLSGIREEVLKEVPGQEENALAGEGSAGGNRGRRIRRIIGRKPAVILIAVVSTALLAGMIAGIVFGVRYYRANSMEYQIARAQACAAAGNTEEAAACYSRALELEENIGIRFRLASLYEQSGRDQEYLNCLSDIISSPYALEEEVETACKYMVSYFEDRKDYASINTLLNNTDNENIRAMFRQYLAEPPQFSYTEGTYAEVIPLKLTADTQGTIYYTMDGTLPDQNSEVYITPIFLETGTYEISAIFVNQYGISSAVVAKTYVIDVLKPPAPEVENYSGEYQVPTMIKVRVPAGCAVYYTTDGTVPTDDSVPYTGEIPMPPGRSIFKFVAYNEEGVAGDCTTRQYTLELDTDLTVNMAIAGLQEILVAEGRLLDTDGTIAGGVQGRYHYRLHSVRHFPDLGDFYILSEIYEDVSGAQTGTGALYAQDIHTGSYYRMTWDGSGIPELELMNGSDS